MCTYIRRLLQNEINISRLIAKVEKNYAFVSNYNNFLYDNDCHIQYCMQY